MSSVQERMGVWQAHGLVCHLEPFSKARLSEGYDDTDRVELYCSSSPIDLSICQLHLQAPLGRSFIKGASDLAPTRYQGTRPPCSYRPWPQDWADEQPDRAGCQFRADGTDWESSSRLCAWGAACPSPSGNGRLVICKATSHSMESIPLVV